MYTAEQLALHVEEIYNEKWLYGWGASGQRLQSIYKTLASGMYYGVKHNNPTGFAILTQKYKNGENPQIVDCYGQVDSLKMEVNDETVYNNTLDSTADNAFNYAKNHGIQGKDWGSINALPKNIRGIGFHRPGHHMTGIGPDRIVNIDSTGYPAEILTVAQAKNKRMVEWFRVPGIDYSEHDKPIVVVTPIEGNVTKDSIVVYQTQIQNIGWQEAAADGEISGTTGKSLRIEAIRIRLNNGFGDIQYRSHVQDTGWMPYVASNEISGTVGMSKRLEAIEIQLIGTISLIHDILYQVHVQDIGWMEWMKNGETAGTIGQSKRIEAIRIKIINK